MEGCVKSGRPGALKLDKLDLSCKANKCSDAGAVDLGVLPTKHQHVSPLVMPAQPAQSECRLKYTYK